LRRNILRNPYASQSDIARLGVYRASRTGPALARWNLSGAAPLNFVSRKSARFRRERMMKYLLSALTALFLFAYLAPDANAFVCARGVYRAGCVGPRGGVVVRRGPACVWRRGVRICR